MIGTVNGISFAITSVASGMIIGFLWMQWAIFIAFWLMWAVLIHLLTITIEEKKTVHSHEKPKKIDIKWSIATIYLIPGLFGLIFFTTFNNFLWGVFMGLMDPYGLSLVSVQTWGIIWWCLSVAMITWGLIITRFWLGKSPLKRLLQINIITWTVCIFFTIQPSIVLLVVGNFIWMLLYPFAEACEQTLLQKVVPFERQWRVFGFAQSIESAASPLTTFMIGPLAQFVFIPFMTTGKWVNLIGSWFGIGEARGIALIFICAGVIGLIVTLLAFLSRSYRLLSQQYTESDS
jgi:DHA3 family multidrug efflux protein-like MFS transporter